MIESLSKRSKMKDTDIIIELPSTHVPEIKQGNPVYQSAASAVGGCVAKDTVMVPDLETFLAEIIDLSMVSFR